MGETMTSTDAPRATETGGNGGKGSNWWSRYLQRHQHPVCLLLHVIAVPMMPVAGVLAVVQLWQGAWGLWWRPVGLLALSYLLQWIGHVIEGNEMGEVVLIKKWLGRPYVAISPRYASRVTTTESPADGKET